MGTDVVAHMATFPERLQLLKANVPRLCSLFPRITICLNGFAEVPRFLRGDERLLPFIPDSDQKDVGKFFGTVGGRRFDFLIDDDIVYPDDYVGRMMAHAESISTPAVLGVHGVVYRPWYLGGARGRRIFHFAAPLASFREVDVLGTGTVIVARGALPPAAYMAGSAGFVDIRFAKYLAERRFRRMSVPRVSGWLQQCPVKSSIFNDFTRRNSLAVLREVNAIRKLRRQIEVTSEGVETSGRR